MGRLSRLAPKVGRLEPRLQRTRDAEGHAVDEEAGREWYSTARWRHPVTGLRMQVLERDLFTCRCGCGVMELDTSKLVADHIRPHKGDPRLFWDPDNLQTLRASPCHNRIKQAQEKRGPVP